MYQATTVWGLQLLVYEALTYYCMGPSAPTVDNHYRPHLRPVPLFRNVSCAQHVSSKQKKAELQDAKALMKLLGASLAHTYDSTFFFSKTKEHNYSMT